MHPICFLARSDNRNLEILRVKIRLKNRARLERKWKTAEPSEGFIVGSCSSQRRSLLKRQLCVVTGKFARRLVTLLIDLSVLAVRRLRVAVAVTTGTVVHLIVGSVLCHSFHCTRALSPILRRRRPTSRRLIAYRRELRTAHLRRTEVGSHLAIHRSFRSIVVGRATLSGTLPFLFGLARSFLFLLLGLPLLADLFEFYKRSKYMLASSWPVLVGVTPS